MTNISRSTPDKTAGGAADTSGEGSTDTDNTGSNTTDINNSNNLTINRQTGNMNVQFSRSNSTVDTSNKEFEGAEPNIGCVLGLRLKEVEKKVACNVFRNKFANYIGKIMKCRNKLVCAVKEYKDTMTDYEEKTFQNALPQERPQRRRKRF